MTAKGVTVSDPLGFPVLAGSALTQAFGFLYGRLGALLDRRSASRDTATPDDRISSLLAGELAPFHADPDAIAQRREQLESLAEVLGVYHDHPALLNGHDERLARNLGLLREALEAVYDQDFTFEGEQRHSSGVKIDQRVNQVVGELVGLDANKVARGAQVEVAQMSETVHDGAKITGAKVKRLS